MSDLQLLFSFWTWRFANIKILIEKLLWFSRIIHNFLNLLKLQIKNKEYIHNILSLLQLPDNQVVFPVEEKSSNK